MEKCFVIQPFDGGRFDKRYDDVLEPAIRDAGLQAYRVDRDPGVGILIDEIEKNIRDSAVCVADITTDNPNVWYEVGFAVAAKKELALVCSSERTNGRFPFDVQHRPVIRYDVQSSSDFAALRAKITERLKAVLLTRTELQTIVQMWPSERTAGLKPHEIAVLVAIAEYCKMPTDAVGLHRVGALVGGAGFNELAVSLGVRGLAKMALISFEELYDDEAREKYSALALTGKGESWLLDNQERLILRPAPDVV